MRDGKTGLTEEDRIIHALLCYSETLLFNKRADIPLPTQYVQDVVDHLEKRPNLVNDCNLRSMQNVVVMMKEREV